MAESPADDSGAELLATLESWFEATIGLLGALRQEDEEGVAAALSARAASLEAHAVALERWKRLPAASRPQAVIEKLNWHRIRINDLDSEVLSFAQALKDQVGDEISRLGTVRKVDRAYQIPAPKPIRILNGEG